MYRHFQQYFAYENSDEIDQERKATVTRLAMPQAKWRVGVPVSQDSANTSGMLKLCIYERLADCSFEIHE